MEQIDATGPSEVLAVLAHLAGADPRAISNTQLRADLLVWGQVIDAAYGAYARWLGEFDERGIPEGEGLRTTEWLRHHLRVAPRAAQRDTLLARRVQTDPDAPLAAALTGGELSASHAAIIDRALHRLPEQVRDTAEPLLVDAAVGLDPADLSIAVERLKETVIPQVVDEEAFARRARRYLNISPTLDGMVAVDALLDPEAGETVLTYLRSAARSQGRDDNRSAGARRADAITTLARAALNNGMPVDRGRRPHITATFDIAAWAAANPAGDHRDHSQCRHGEPSVAGGFAHLDDGTALSTTALMRLLCDANISRVITNGPSEILDVGRATRVISPALRLALRILYNGCASNGCRTPANQCDAHHVKHWTRHGDTALDNLVPLCERHHNDVHDGLLIVLRDGNKFRIARTPGDDHPRERGRAP